ncbi:MAG: HAMP domain-containing sensor histidine kinase [Luteimonas sp.]
MSQPSGVAESQFRDLYIYSLYRVLEAALLTLLLFGPVRELLPTPLHPLLAKATAVAYLAVSVPLLYWALREVGLRGQVMVGLVIDIAVAFLAVHAIPSAASGIALLLIFNVGASALLLPLRYGLAGGALAGAAMIGEFIWSTLGSNRTDRPLAEPLMFAVSFLSIAMLTHLLGRQIRESQALADRRGDELADMAAVNELIIRRMRTGVLLVDADGSIRLANEAALLQLGDHGGERKLVDVAPELAERLTLWLQTGISEESSLRMGNEQPEVLPRFARLLAYGDAALVFLDDTSLVSRRAESLTLATLGRFSASLAHEIRNPLAAINYATQLLQESSDINVAHQRLLHIIHSQCQRTNGIVENVLGLARRERASADHIDLAAFAQRFVEDYKQVLPPDSGTVVVGGMTQVHALVDPRHLQQVMTVLVQNALSHWHLPGDPAQVTVEVHVTGGRPTLDVRDRGPGIAAEAREQLFSPFFTTSELGTGLGLYIARDLCRANEATLDYIDLDDGSSCFRVTLPDPQALLPA